MTVYEILIEMSRQHRRIKKKDGHKMGHTDTFRFDLESKTVSNGFMNIFKNGELVADQIELCDGTVYDFRSSELISSDTDFYHTVEKLYNEFQYSVPTKHDNICRTNFLAKHVDELSMSQIMNNEKRPVARCKLEAYVLLMAVSQQIPWNEQRHFFWKSKNVQNLILYRDWCR